ncbi:MAG: hypothetical protein ACSHWY_10675, partial [Octadecabacter sp.]
IQTLDLSNAALPDDLSVLTTLPKLRALSLSDWPLEDSQQAVIDQLEAKGVTILRVPSLIAC